MLFGSHTHKCYHQLSGFVDLGSFVLCLVSHILYLVSRVSCANVLCLVPQVIRTLTKRLVDGDTAIDSLVVQCTTLHSMDEFVRLTDTLSFPTVTDDDNRNSTCAHVCVCVSVRARVCLCNTLCMVLMVFVLSSCLLHL